MAATRILPGGAIIDGVSMAANITSDTLDVQGAGVVGLQFVAASGTHVGTFAVELSVDGSTWDATNFRISAGTSATSVAAANGVALAELVLVDVGAARHLRVTYTFTSGAGTAYVYAVRKRLAASEAGNLAKLEARIAQPNMLTAPSSISVDTSSAAVTGLTVGTTYMVYSTVPCFVEVGPDAVAAATSNTYIEPGLVFVWTPTADNTDDGIAAIASVAGGKVYVQACQA